MHAWGEVCHHRASSLPSQASYAVLALESQTFFKHSQHTISISNSAILRNNYISLLSDFCACVHVKKKWRRKGSHSSLVGGSNRLVWLEKSDGLVLCSVNCAAVLCDNHRERVTQIWASPSEEEEEEERKTFWSSGDFLVRYFRDAFLVPLGVLFEDEW